MSTNLPDKPAESSPQPSPEVAAFCLSRPYDHIPFAVTVVAVMMVVYLVCLVLTVELLGVVSVAAVVLLAIYRDQRMAYRWNSALRLVEGARHDEALPILREQASSARVTVYRAAAVLEWAVILELQGKYEDARVLLTQLIDKGWTERRELISRERRELAARAPEIHVRLARTCILLGDLDQARARISAGKQSTDPGSAAWYPPDALLLAREEAWEELLAMLDRMPASAWQQLRDRDQRMLNLLWALGLVRVERYDGYREDRWVEIEQLLRGVEPGEFDRLAAHWPALQRFLWERSLSEPG